MFLKIGHRLTVDFYHLERTRFLYQILRHDTHTRSNLQYRKIGTCIYGVGYRLGNVQVGQKVLAEVLLRSYLFHGDKDTIFFSFVQKKDELDSHPVRLSYAFFTKILSILLHFHVHVVIDLYGFSNTYCNDKCYHK